MHVGPSVLVKELKGVELLSSVEFPLPTRPAPLGKVGSNVMAAVQSLAAAS